MSDQTPAQPTSDAPDDTVHASAPVAPDASPASAEPEATPAPQAAEPTDASHDSAATVATGTGDADVVESAEADAPQAAEAPGATEAVEAPEVEDRGTAPADAQAEETAQAGADGSEDGTTSEQGATTAESSAPAESTAPAEDAPTAQGTTTDTDTAPQAPRPAADAPTPGPRPTPAAPAPTPVPAPPAPTAPSAAPPAPTSAAVPTPTPPQSAPSVSSVPEHPSPAVFAEHPHPPTPGAVPIASAPASDSTSFGRVEEDGTVYVRTPEGERAVGSYPGATPEEALAYFARKYDEVSSIADLLYQRVTQTDLSTKEAGENLAKLREAATDIHAVGDLVALAAKVENIATALQARRVVEGEQRAAARAEATAAREKIVAEAEQIAGQPEAKVQWKSSSARMRALLDEWKAAQRGGPKLDRETEQALWQRLSSSRNSFDKMRRVHFAQLGSTQAEAKAAKQELVAEAEQLATSTDWGATAGAFKRLMDRWRQAGRASRTDDDALWKRFKAAQDSFFAAKDAVVAAENEEFSANLVVKQELLTQAQALLPITDLDAAKSALRGIQEKWDAAGKVPRADMDRIEKAMRRVEQAVRDVEDKRWKATNPEVAARAASLASQAEAALERYRRDLEKAERSGDTKKIAKAREALEAREAWLNQARAGMAEFGGSR